MKNEAIEAKMVQTKLYAYSIIATHGKGRLKDSGVVAVSEGSEDAQWEAFKADATNHYRSIGFWDITIEGPHPGGSLDGVGWTNFKTTYLS